MTSERRTRHPPETGHEPHPPPESSLRRELWAILVMYLALAVVPILFGLAFGS